MTRQFGKPDQERELAQINQVIDDCFLLIGEQLRLRDIQSKNECDPGLPRIMGGGVIRVAQSGPEGTTFCVELPVG